MVDLKVGVTARGWGAASARDPKQALEAGRRAEATSLDGIHTGDHVTFYGKGTDGLLTLAAIAAVTERIELKTSVYLLPLRHPSPVALQAAQLDQLSGGRLIFGVGVGGEDPKEFEACGVDVHTRGARTNEAIQIIKLLWSQDHVTFEGDHYQLRDITMNPKPTRPIPVHIGGRSNAALERAGRLADGYTGIWLSLDRFRSAAETIAAAATEAGRDASAVELGLQVWTSVDDNRGAARTRVAAAMEDVYRIPFDRFERYTPYGSAHEIAEHLAPYVELGARHFSLIPVQPTLEETIDRAAEIRGALLALQP